VASGSAQKGRPRGYYSEPINYEGNGMENMCTVGDRLVTRRLARIRLSDEMAHDHLVCPPSVAPATIRHALRLYMRFTLSYRDVEDLLAERGLDISYETVRRWVLKFGPLFARELRRRRPRPTLRWHLDEMAVTIAGG
jgi:hypothetical protein